MASTDRAKPVTAEHPLPGSSRAGRDARSTGIQSRLNIRFVAVWFALLLLGLATLVLAPTSFSASSIATLSPLVAILAVAALGQTLVIMTAGIDLSVPAILTMVGVMLVKVSGGSDAGMITAIAVALILSTIIGFANGTLVSLFRISPLVVTLGMGQVVTGATLWYRGALLPDAQVPPALAVWATQKVFSVSYVIIFVLIPLLVIMSVILTRTAFGRRFVAMGANYRAALVLGIPVRAYQITAYTAAAFLYGVAGVLLAAFVRSPAMDMGGPYLLATVVVVVLGGALLSGGPASVLATFGGAIFITLLDQVLRVRGLSTGYQMLMQGVVLLLGMALMSNLDPQWFRRLLRRPAD